MQNSNNKELNLDLKTRVIRECSDAFHHHVDEFGFCIVDRQDGYRPARGTLVQIAGRLLAITAAHAIPENPAGRLFFFGSTPKLTNQDIRIVRFGRIPAARPDVGYFEFDPNEAPAFLGKSACSLTRLSLIGASDPHRFVGVVGCPSDKKYFRVDNKRMLMRASSILVTSTPYGPNEWPDSDPKSDANVDVFLEYPETDTCDAQSWENVNLPEPYGFSGGGVWDYGFDLGLWSPEKAKLVAVQSSWHEKKRYLRGALVAHWLRLIYEDYTDLRAELDQAFPGLVR